jgi:hypothetical protein
MPFELRLIGAGDPETDTEWQMPPEPAEAKTTHASDREWVNTELTLTVGSEVYTFDSAPVYLTCYGTMDIDTDIRTIEEGSADVQHVRVTETISFYN